MSILNADLLPGTTVSAEPVQAQPIGSSMQSTTHHGTSRPGPLINGRASTITLLSPTELAASPFPQSMFDKGRAAFAASYLPPTNILPQSIVRYLSIAGMLQELGTAASTFTSIIHYSDTADVIGTCSVWRLRENKILVADAKPVEPAADDRGRIIQHLTRVAPLPDDVDPWEVKMLAVDPAVQRHGIAKLLMDLCEEETKRRHLSAQVSQADGQRTNQKTLIFILTGFKETVGAFYLKRGYTIDSEHRYPKGTVNSDIGFTVWHMSKQAAT